MKIIKKILTPILNLLLIPVGMIMLFNSFELVRYIENTIGPIEIYDIGGRNDSTLILILLLIVSFIVFWSGNAVIQSIENNKKPKLIDHIRQSALLYMVLIASVVIYIPNPISECESDCHGYLFIIGPGVISLIAIFINWFFIHKLSKLK